MCQSFLISFVAIAPPQCLQGLLLGTLRRAKSFGKRFRTATVSPKDPMYLEEANAPDTLPEDCWGLGLIAWGFRVLSTYTEDTNPTKYLIIQNVEILLCTIY